MTRDESPEELEGMPVLLDHRPDRELGTVRQLTASRGRPVAVGAMLASGEWTVKRTLVAGVDSRARELPQ
jgi:hypothetical protein